MGVASRAEVLGLTFEVECLDDSAPVQSVVAAGSFYDPALAGPPEGRRQGGPPI